MLRFDRDELAAHSQSEMSPASRTKTTPPRVAWICLTSNYELRVLGKDRQFGTRDDKVIALRSVAYDPQQQTVTLVPRKQLKINESLRSRCATA